MLNLGPRTVDVSIADKLSDAIEVFMSQFDTAALVENDHSHAPFADAFRAMRDAQDELETTKIEVKDWQKKVLATVAKAKEDEEISPVREQLTLWTVQNPADHITKVAVSAWNNCPIDRMPPEWNGHTCEASKKAWARVAKAIVDALIEGYQPERT